MRVCVTYDTTNNQSSIAPTRSTRTQIQNGGSHLSEIDIKYGAVLAYLSISCSLSSSSFCLSMTDSIISRSSGVKWLRSGMGGREGRRLLIAHQGPGRTDDKGDDDDGDEYVGPNHQS